MNQAAVSVKQRQRPDSSRGLFVHIMVRTVGRPCCSTPLLRKIKNDPKPELEASAAAVPVDIPDSWDPRTKQQPTGLIACRLRAAVLFDPSSLQDKK